MLPLCLTQLPLKYSNLQLWESKSQQNKFLILQVSWLFLFSFIIFKIWCFLTNVIFTLKCRQSKKQQRTYKCIWWKRSNMSWMQDMSWWWILKHQDIDDKNGHDAKRVVQMNRCKDCSDNKLYLCKWHCKQWKWTYSSCNQCNFYFNQPKWYNSIQSLFSEWYYFKKNYQKYLFPKMG